MIFYDYAIGKQVFVNIKGIIQKLDIPKNGPYTTIYLLTNSTVKIQRRNVNKYINILRLENIF